MYYSTSEHNTFPADLLTRARAPYTARHRIGYPLVPARDHIEICISIYMYISLEHKKIPVVPTPILSAN